MSASSPASRSSARAIGARAVTVRIVSRRALLWVFQIPGLFVVPVVFFFAADSSLAWAKWGIFAAGLFTVSQFSFWGNYLPHVYPVHLRGTGESFAANIGGRMIGTPFAALTQYLALQSFVPGSTPPEKTAFVAAGIATALYLLNLIMSFVLPEPKPGAMERD